MDSKNQHAEAARQAGTAALAALLCAAGLPSPAHAQSVAGTGQVSPGPVQSPDWAVGADLVVGDTAVGELAIDAGGTVSNADAYIGNGAGGQGTVTVSGSDGSGQASAWTSTGQAMIGVENGSIGTLQILGGAVVNSGAAVIGRDAGSVGDVAVSGAGSAWTISTVSGFVVGDGGTGTLAIGNGGAVESGQGIIGWGGSGAVTVSGAGSTWDPFNNIYVGFESTGELDVEDGATVATVAVGGGAATIYIGYDAAAQGTVNVSSSTGDTSTLSASDALIVGDDGIGTLNIGKGGMARVANRVYVANAGTASGTLNLTGDAGGRGVLQTGSVVKGAGTAVLDLDGGILRANRDEADFLDGFATLAVGGEGAWFDTDGHDVGVGTAFSGASSLNKLGAGILTLTGNSVAFTGATQVRAGTLQVDGTLGGPITVRSGARLTGTGRVGTASNRGTIAPGPRSGFGTLTVAGDYAGQGGGLDIRTRLGGDGSPTDRLVVTGATSGTTPVAVTNVGGTGAQTRRGIRVVQVDGVSAGRFDLANGDYVMDGQPALVAGAYGYVLQKDPGDGDWYLRSSLREAGTQEPGGGGVPGSAPDEGGMLYQPGVPVYEAYANTILSLSRFATLRQRVGNRRHDPADTGRDGIWARMEGTASHLEPSASSTGAQQNIDSWRAQFGVDRILAGKQDGSRLVGGLNVRYGTADTRVSSVHGDGSIDTTGYGVGTTLTWYGRDGAYVDSQAQASWFDSDLRSGLAGRLASAQDAHGYGLSIEAGQALPLLEGLAVIPQAQLSYVSTRFGRFDDRFGARVDSARGDSLQGRIGVALDYRRSWQDAGGRTREAGFYGLVNVKREFLDGTQVRVSGVPVDSRLGRTWTGVAVGGSYGRDGRYALYGELAADSDWSGSYSVTATAGLRMVF